MAKIKLKENKKLIILSLYAIAGQNYIYAVQPDSFIHTHAHILFYAYSSKNRNIKLKDYLSVLK